MASAEVTNTKINRVIWARFVLLATGTFISLPWLQELIQKLAYFDMTWFVTVGEPDHGISDVTPNIAAIGLFVLSEIAPLTCLVLLAFQLIHFVGDKDISRLRLSTRLLWIKTALPGASFLLISFYVMMIGLTYELPPIDQMILNPLSGFWLYSVVLAFVANAIERWEKPRRFLADDGFEL